MVQWWRTAGNRLRTVAYAVNSRTYHTIQAIPREVTGRRVAAKERAQGRIPAVVFSQQFSPSSEGGLTRSIARKHLLSTEKKQIHSILKTINPEFFCSTTFKLQIRAGSGSSMLVESGNVLPIKLHRDQETGQVLNMVFVWADDEGSELAVDVPILFKGEESCPGLKKGGQLNKVRTTLKYLCPAQHIPQKTEVDISKLDIGDTILLHDVEVPSSVKLISKRESKPICKIVATSAATSEPIPA